MMYTDERGNKYDDTPVPREPEKQTCRNCHRTVISDGHGDVLHEEDYRYQCTGKPMGTFAEVRHGR